MVDPVNNFRIEPHALGGELDLYWELPEENLPDNYLIFIFKREGNDITQKDIDDYFASGKRNDKVYVNSLAPSIENVFYDLQTINGKQYFYAIVIQSQDELTNKEYSSPQRANATPVWNQNNFILFDSKDVAIKGSKKIFDNLELEDNPNVTYKVPVLKQWNVIQKSGQWITVHRATSEIAQRFFGDVIAQNSNHVASGVIEEEVIQVTWYCRDNVDRMDKITKVMKAHHIPLKRYFLYSGAIEALFSYTGEAIASVEDSNEKSLFSSMLIKITHEHQTFFDLPSAEDLEFEVIIANTPNQFIN